MNEKNAYEDYSASHITTKFTKYELPMNNNNNRELGQIVFYDAPGNTDDPQKYEDYKKALEKTLNFLKMRKDNSSILLYFIKKDGNGLTDNALNYLKFLDKKFKIIFIITHSKKNSESSIKYRKSVINVLSRNNVLTGGNLEMLRKDNGYNVINVNLKEDEDHGEFYGFKEIYEKISNFFPQDFPELIDRGLRCNNLDQLMGFIAYENFFFLENCKNIKDFFENINSKIDTHINIQAALCSLSGLIPIPFADVPCILMTQTLLIKLMVIIYGINKNEYNHLILSTFGPVGSFSALGWNFISKIALSSTILDLIPIVGNVVSAIVNPITITTFGKALKNHFMQILENNGKFFSLIKNVLNDYKSIYFQIDELSKKEKDSFEEEVLEDEILI